MFERREKPLKMRLKFSFYEDSTTCSVIAEEMPVTMKELSLAKFYDFDFKYGQKTAWDFNDDLATIDRSMMHSPKRNQHRFKKRRKYPKFRFVPRLEDIQENELFHVKDDEDVKFSLERDLLAIHEERALGCSTPLLEDGRRYRYCARRTRHCKGGE